MSLIKSATFFKVLYEEAPNLDLYGLQMGKETYATLLTLARSAVEGGQTAVLDATYLRRAYRRKAIDFARQLGADIQIAHCDVPLPVLRERIRKRGAEGSDVSDADEKVLEKLAQTFEPFSGEEISLLRSI